MLYLASMLCTEEKVDFTDDIEIWQQLVQGIERLDFHMPIYKVWVVTDVLHGDTSQSHIFSINGNVQEVDEIIKTAPSYLYAQPVGGETAISLLSTDQKSLQSLRALIANLYEPVVPISLDSFLQTHDQSPVWGVDLYDGETGIELREAFPTATTMNDLLANHPSPRWSVLNVAVTLPDSILPSHLYRLIDPAVSLDTVSNQIQFSLEDHARDEDQEDVALLSCLFSLAEKVFKDDQVKVVCGV